MDRLVLNTPSGRGPKNIFRTELPVKTIGFGEMGKEFPVDVDIMEYNGDIQLEYNGIFSGIQGGAR